MGTLGLSASTRLLAAVAIGAVGGALAALAVAWPVALLLGWDIAALVWAGTVWIDVLRLDAAATTRHATREDPSRPLADSLLLMAGAASLAAIAVVAVKAGAAHGVGKALLIAVSVASVFISWTLIHTLFTLRYAALYYTGSDGGIDLNQDAEPTYGDFAYVAFTIGMTFQVSDTNLTDTAVRRTALRHALLSFVFGAVILASIINLVGGLVH